MTVTEHMLEKAQTLYRVTIDPAGHHCTCEYAGFHPLAPCSHSVALELQAEKQQLLAQLQSEAEPEREEVTH